MTSLTFGEEMEGFVSFDERDFNQALAAGRRDGIRCSFRLRMEIDDVDRFAAEPEHVALATGVVRCDELGGELAVERGTFNLLVQRPDPRHRQMLYRLFLRDGDGRPLTLSGFKVLRDDPNLDIWSDASTLFVRLYAGHIAATGESARRVVATGIVRMDHPGFLALIASMRVSGGGPLAQVTGRERFARVFLGGMTDVYGGRSRSDGLPDFPSVVSAVEPFDGQRPGAWHDLDGHPGLRRRILPLTAGDGRHLTLHNIRSASEPRRGPVLLAHGCASRANIFYGAPLTLTLVDVLVARGFDVWVENWRASIDLPASNWTLDQAAVFDHPAAVAEIRRQTGWETMKAVVHCQGSCSFTMAALAGLVPEVTTVVSNAVSLHIRVPLRSKIKQYCLVPALGLFYRGVDPQWALRSPSAVATGLVRWARLVRHECDNAVCSVSNYCYGVGPDVLWRHTNLEDDVHAWLSREFGYCPLSFYRQMARCVRAGHLVGVDELPALPESFVDGEPRTDARFAFIAGALNRCFSPEGQRRTFEHFDALRPNHHSHYEMPNYSHMDMLFGRRAYRDVHPIIVRELERAA